MLDEQEDIHRAWKERYRSGPAGEFKGFLTRRDVYDACIKPGSKVLDAGCGTGNHVFEMASMGLSVTGVDFSPFAIAECRADRRRAEGNTEFLQASLTELPFPEATFDCVTVFGVLMHIPDFEEAAAECVRVTRSGGRLIIRETNARSAEITAMGIWHKVSRNRRVRTEHHPFGLNQYGPQGLLSRKLLLPWFTDYMNSLGCRLVATHPTSSDVLTHRKLMLLGQRLPHLLNRFVSHKAWGHHIVSGVTMIYEKE